MHWRFWLLALCCWPLLLWQGKRVRKLALRLPEAGGERSGILGHGPKQQLLICGDSAAAGVGCHHQQQALSGQLVGLLAQQAEVHWQLHAQTGINSAQLRQHLLELEAKPLSWVVVSIGVNDVTGLSSARQFRAQINALVQLINQRFSTPQIIFSAIPPMQHFSALPAPLNHWLGLKASQLNQQLVNTLATWPNARVLSSTIELTPEMLAQDGFHPSVAGAKQWASLLAAEIQRLRYSK
ncbi:SGNH/GDSL hydrolase family protein [Alkalimonas sp. MEB108]|uniref:SGNH/GDSL hydrolase family protein n=1 Tax=Alkalimonas cellulosilytica TaxID=3058395 RepID=A0ABU7J293_9GAMM|nr:SGNH/GDSL hydrolase family protein [Alkalimonas sp. MEB108]MEE2000614.1 SGNH/GDSL hydrolase family protein [Alkalimonas sp. MEB108]